MILEHAPPPRIEKAEGAAADSLAMWVSTLDHDNYLGFLAIGRIEGGALEVGKRISIIRPKPETEADLQADCVETFRVTKLLAFQGLRRFEIR